MRCEGPPFEFPGEAAADKRPPSRTSGLQARQGAAHFALPRISVSEYSSSAPPAGGNAASDFRLEARIKGRRYARAQNATPQNVSASPPSVTRWQPQCSAGKSAALGASLGVGPAPPVVCQAEPATPLPAPFLRGTAPPCSNLPAIPPHLRREESRRKCSGQAGSGPPVRWRRQCQSSQICSPAFASAQLLRCPPQTARFPPHQRRCLCASVRRSVPVRGDRRATHQRPLALTPLSRSGSGPVGRLPSHNVGLFRCSREPCVSLPRRSRARRPSRCQTPSGATLHFVPRPMALADSQPPPAGPHTHPAAVRLPAP